MKPSRTALCPDHGLPVRAVSETWYGRHCQLWMCRACFARWLGIDREVGFLSGLFVANVQYNRDLV